MSSEKIRARERNRGAENAKKRKARKKKRQGGLALVVILLITVTTLAVLSLTVFFKTSEISIKGNTSYSAEEIISAAEISIGDNLFLISERRLTQRLSKHLPLIDKVEISRTLPDKITINVIETKEEICFSAGNKYFSANQSGKVIKEYSSCPENLVLVTVSNKTKLKQGETAVFSTEREQELFNNYFGMIEERGFDVNFVNIADPYNSYMKLEGRLIIKFGSSSYFERKSAFLSAGLKGISKNATGTLDLSGWTPENDQPVLTYGDVSEIVK